ncbi:GNAT superfamily N-acetyltransferase [Crossiella equi]|uniref:GNAT superfamily N-acetyltransferase n=1 Tax=Crossiella equi TaxID=130796 RepID=A0ABS5A7K7_9PSEU|nr:GNAT family N-acetyltransferase [Crossiella equi]MBP2472579.1 GNAT superfamily N-acetyltransferase [Crossiella equi]
MDSPTRALALAAPVLRRAGPADLDALLDLHRRCSPETLRRRFLGAPQTSASVLGTLLTRDGTYTVLTFAGREAVATGSLFTYADEAELAFLVRDDWQRRGLGRALVRHLAEAAHGQGVRTLHLCAYADNTPVRRLVHGLARSVRQSVTDGVLSVEVTLTR